MPDAAQQMTLRLLTEGGGYTQPVDTRIGPLYRPAAKAQSGGFVSTVETLYDFWIDDIPDPDEALRLDPNIREKIRLHPDVQGAMRKRELTVASLPDRIEPSEEAEDRKAAEFVAKYVEWAYRQLPGLPKLYQGLQQAVIDGGIGVEFVWHRDANGVERPTNWHTVDKSRFCRDRQGNLAIRTRTQPVWGSYVSANPNEWLWKDFPHGKFLYHIYKQMPGPWDNPQLEGYQYWGLGEDVALYYLVTFDIFALRFRMKWLEKFGIPPTDIYYPENTPQYTGTIRRIADSLRGESVTLIPRMVGAGNENHYFTVKQREVPSNTYDQFSAFSDGYTLPRVSSLLLGSSDEMHRTEKGGYSSDVSRKDSGPNIIYRWDARNIAETINRQLIPAIAWSRFPNLPYSYLPKLILEPKEEKDRDQEIGIIEKAAKLVPIPQSAVYDAVAIPRPHGDEPTVGGEQQQQQQMPPGSPVDPKQAPLTVPGAGAQQGPDRTKPSTPIGQ